MDLFATKEGYLSDIEKILRSLFSSISLNEQPRFLVEIGCRDGFLLKHTYEFVTSQLYKGKKNTEYPLEIVALVLDENLVDRVRQDLVTVPHRIARIADIRSFTIIAALHDIGIDSSELAFYIETIPKSNNARRFRDYTQLETPHGILLLQLHCLSPDFVNLYWNQIDAFQRENVVDLSLYQSAEQYLMEAASAGWFPKVGFSYHYPESLPITYSSINHFEQRSYVIRQAVPEDLPRLMAFEPKSLATSKHVLSLIKDYPEGQLVIESPFGIEGVVYSQRISTVDSLYKIQEAAIETPHDPKGPIVHLLSLNVLPEKQRLGLDNQLLEFFLQKASVTNGVTNVIGNDGSNLYSVLDPSSIKERKHPEKVPIMLYDKSNKSHVFNDWLYEIEWQSSPLSELQFVSFDRLWVIFADPNNAISQRTKEMLKENRQYCVMVYPGKEFGKIDATTFMVDPSSIGDYLQLFQNISNITQLEGVIYLWGYDAIPVNTFESIDALHKSILGSAVILANAMSQSMLPAIAKLWFVMRSINTDGTIESLVQWPLGALCKIIREEYSKLQCTYLALDSAESTEKACLRLLNELKGKSNEPQIAWREDRRLVPRMIRTYAESARRPELLSEASYMVLGGLRSLGLMIAQWYVEHGAKHLVLLDETEIHSEAEGVINELKTLGVEITLHIVNFDDHDALSTIFNMIKQSSNPLKGVIHAAGLVDDELLLHMNWERFIHIHRLKVAGSWMLHQLTLDLPLDHFILFSTVLTDFIPIGLASHATANSFLDALTYYRTKNGLKSLAIDWGPWERRHVKVKHIISANPTNRLEQLNVEDAFKILENIFYYNKPEVIVANINWPSDLHPLLNPFFNKIGIELGFKSEEIAVKSTDKKHIPHLSEEPIAIVGMSGRFPGASNLHEYWDLLISSRDPIKEVPPNRWNINEYYDPDPSTPGKMSSRYGGFIESIDQFDASFFSITPKEAETLDPQQRILLELTWEALENANIAPNKIKGSKASIFVGVSYSDYGNLLSQQDKELDFNAYQLTGNLLSATAGRLAYFLDVHGQCVAIDTATSSSAVAIHNACQNLREGESPLAIAAGVNIILSPRNSICFTKIRVIAPDGRCKTFDASADGICRSEGCGVIILKRLKDAIRDNDHVLAVVKSSVINQGGESTDLMAPSLKAQVSLLKDALAGAHLSSEGVDYIETHGTGTPLGDVIETKAILEVYGSNPKRNQELLIGSVKSNIGHLEAASGIAGLIKVVLAFQNQVIPRNLHLKKLNPKIRLDEIPAKVVADSHSQWIKSPGRTRRAGINSFGFMGTNCHIIIEEAPVSNQSLIVAQDREFHMLTVSAKNEKALEQSFDQFQRFLSSTHDSLADIAYTSNVGRNHFSHRAVVIARGINEAYEKILKKEYQKGIIKFQIAPKIAFYFTGQGSQYIGMGKQLYFYNPAFKSAIDRCAQFLREKLEDPLFEILFFEEGLLNQKKYTPLAIFSFEYAMAELWKSLGIIPSYVLGHDVGELVAAVEANVLTVEDALTLILNIDDLHSSSFTNSITYKAPSIALISSLNGAFLSEKQLNDEYWVRLLREPVQSQKIVDILQRLQCPICIEIGPQPVMADMDNQSIPTPLQETLWLYSIKKNETEWLFVLNNLAKLYIQGIDINWKGFDDRTLNSKVSIPTYPFQRQQHWAISLQDKSISFLGNKAETKTIISHQTEYSQLSLEFTALPSNKRRSWLMDYLRAEVQKAMGIISDIEVNRGFFELGMTSLMTIEIRQNLQNAIGADVQLSETLLIDYPNIVKLAAFLEEKLTSSNSPASVPILQNKITPAIRQEEPIAIIGMGCRLPGNVKDPETYWDLLVNGIDAIREVPKERWDIDAYYDSNPDAPNKMVSRFGGFVSNIDTFDATFFGIIPREAEGLDPQQRLVLETSWEALERAGIAPNSLNTSLTGVFIGVSNTDYYSLLLKNSIPADLQDHVATGNALSGVSGRISYILGLQGPSLSIDTACSSSLVAIHEACETLRSGICNLAIAGGVNIILSPEMTSNYSRAHMLASDGHCKTFDAKADGYVRGEGCGILILKRLSDALKDGDPILAVIRAAVVNQGGSSGGLTVPNRIAQEQLLEQALVQAKITPAEIQYIEAHGTGTNLGDPIEMGAILNVFGKGRTAENPLFVGSVKTNIGHLESAAGVAGVIKTVLSLQHQIIPKHLHFTELNPKIQVNNVPLKIPIEAQPWPEGSHFAGISSFGFTGTNAHIILEQGPLQLNSLSLSHQLIVLSASTKDSLQKKIQLYVQQLENQPEKSLAELAYIANVKNTFQEFRCGIIAETYHDLLSKLKNGDYEIKKAPQKLPKIAFLFTGQGSQYPKMGKQLYETQRIFKEVLDRCAKVLDPLLKKPFLNVLFNSEGDRTELDQTGYTQPILFAFEYALAELWKSWGIIPDYVMGHSAGEFAAATIAGIISLEDGLKLITDRARLMQSLPSGGAMGALEVDLETLRKAIIECGVGVDIGAVNGPKQTVVSGKEQDVLKILEFFKQQNVKVHRLHVSHASHSSLMEPMLNDFLKIAETVDYHPPQVQVISNITGKMIGSESISAEYWTKHIRQPVMFYESMQTLKAQGCELFLEIGPHPVLVRMGRSSFPEGQGLWLPSMIRDRDEWKTLWESISELYLNGAKIDFKLIESNLIPRGSTQKERPMHLLTLSAKKEQSLLEMVKSYQQYLQANPQEDLANIAFTANMGRTHFETRLAVTSKTSAELLSKLEKGSYVIKRIPKKQPLIAFLFTGHGSQYSKMGKQLYDSYPIFKEAIDFCANKTDSQSGKSLINFMFNAENNIDFNREGIAEIALFAFEYALSELWKSWGILPDYVIGHGIGEYASATVAGILSPDDALKLVSSYSRLISSLPEGGSMAVVLTDRETTLESLLACSANVVIAAVNTTKHCIISGKNAEIDKALEYFKQKNIPTQRTNMRHAYHSPLMEPIVEEFRQIASSIIHKTPSVGFISGLYGGEIPSNISMENYWVEQLRSPVEFYKGIQQLDQQDCKIFLEVGPQPILISIGMQCLPAGTGTWLQSIRRGQDEWRTLVESLAQIYLQGIPVNWKGFDAPYLRHKLILPTYQFQRNRFWFK